jgi:cyanophycinase
VNGASPGPLVLVGGGEDRTGPAVILREIVRLAGGSNAHILILGCASDQPRETGAAYVEVFRRLGAGEARCLDIASRAEANAPSATRAVEGANAVFFTGGDQVRITRLVGGTKLDTALHACREQGMVVAGTSAGATAMSSVMIVQGLAETTPRIGVVEMGPGMEFIGGVLIDQHFAERGRIGRLLSAVAQYPHDLGIGIDENTALVVREAVFEVIGEGAVTILDAGASTHSNALSIKRNEPLALCGIRLHVLPAPYRFDLRRRAPLVDESGDG